MSVKETITHIKETLAYNQVLEWCYKHNILKDKEELAKADDMLRSADATGDYSEWNRYGDQISSLDHASRWWVTKPSLELGKPWAHGSDEYNRRTYVFGFPFTGRLMIASKKKTCTHYDKEANASYIDVVSNTLPFCCSLETIEVGHGVNIDVDKETGQLFGIEILHP